MQKIKINSQNFLKLVISHPAEHIDNIPEEADPEEDLKLEDTDENLNRHPDFPCQEFLKHKNDLKDINRNCSELLKSKPYLLEKHVYV